MKIFSWMRGKRCRNEEGSNPQPKSYRHQSRFGLLAIGTFGNSKERMGVGESEEDQPDNGSDLEQVDRELRLLLNSKHITVEQLLDCLRDGDGDAHLQRKSSLLVHAQPDNSIGKAKESLSFLIKKALLCGGGFVAAPPPPPPPPILRDPLPDLSRMEKILRAMLHKKIYPQRPTPKKYLDMPESESEDEGDHKSKWVKTDSEYIVLEI